MRGTRLRTGALEALFGVLCGVLAISCSATGTGHGPSPSISPPSTGDGSVSATPSASPSGSPGPESPLAVGSATLTLTGDLALNVSLPAIQTPAVWAPPPAPMDITWAGGPSVVHLSGTSFVSLAETSALTVLSFSVQGPNGPVEFTSSAGECSITITPALPDNMGGVFTCTLLTDAAGAVTVDARGAFSASG